VERLWGQDRYYTAIRIAEKIWTIKPFSKVFVTSGGEFQYAMMIAPYASKEGLPLLFSEKNTLNKAVSDNIIKWKINNADIIADKNFISKTVEESLISLGLGVERIPGYNFSEINVNIINKYKMGPNGLAVASPNYCGDIRHCTVEDSFSFTTRVTLLNTPQFAENTTPLEFEYFTDKLHGCDICADPVLGRNPCEQIFDFTETFNEKPYVELIRARVIEVDIHKNPDRDCCTPTEQLFDRFTEKAVVYLTLKVLQKQQLVVNAVNANGTGTPGTTLG
jgi:hypothetical protein